MEFTTQVLLALLFSCFNTQMVYGKCSSEFDPKCVSALMNHTYETCQEAVKIYTKNWSICQIDSCEDHMQLVQQAGWKRKSMDVCIHFISDYINYVTYVFTVFAIINMMLILDIENLLD